MRVDRGTEEAGRLEVHDRLGLRRLGVEHYCQSTWVSGVPAPAARKMAVMAAS